jgi:hypothetical protein
MPSKITAGIPSKRFKGDLERLLALPDEQIKRLIHWLASGKNALPNTTKEFVRMAEAVGAEDRDLTEIFGVLRFVMTSWRRNNLSLDEVIGDLKGLGLSEDQLQTSRTLFSGLEVTKEQFFASEMRRTVEASGLPTLDDLTFHWDLRPIFASPAYPLRDGDEDGVSDWLSHTYLLILELDSSSSQGDSSSLTVQITESEFADLENAVQRARKQLEVLKAKRFL